MEPNKSSAIKVEPSFVRDSGTVQPTASRAAGRWGRLKLLLQQFTTSLLTFLTPPAIIALHQ